MLVNHTTEVTDDSKRVTAAFKNKKIYFEEEMINSWAGPCKGLGRLINSAGKDYYFPSLPDELIQFECFVTSLVSYM